MSARPSSKHLRGVCLERDDYTCQVCGLREPEIMHVDHKLPRYVATENYDTLENLVTLCPNDHARKTAADRKKYGHPAWNRGKKMTAEFKAKMDTSGLEKGRRWAKGRKFTAEHRASLSAAHKGKPGVWKGKKFSLEHRQKLRDAKLRKCNEVIINVGYA